MDGRRALSPILSTMILLTAALLAGILLYNYFNKMLHSMMSTPNVAIQSADYYPDIDVLSVEVKKMGGTPIPLNGTQLVIMGRGSSCTCSITCTSPATLGSNGELQITIYGNGTGTTSFDACTVECSNYSACKADLAAGTARVAFRYVYQGSQRMTGFEEVIIG